MAIRPDVVHLERSRHSPGAVRAAFLPCQAFEERFPHGVIGMDTGQASVEVGEQVLATAQDLYELVLTQRQAG